MTSQKAIHLFSSLLTLSLFSLSSFSQSYFDNLYGPVVAQDPQASSIMTVAHEYIQIAQSLITTKSERCTEAHTEYGSIVEGILYCTIKANDVNDHFFYWGDKSAPFVCVVGIDELLQKHWKVLTLYAQDKKNNKLKALVRKHLQIIQLLVDYVTPLHFTGEHYASLLFLLIEEYEDATKVVPELQPFLLQEYGPLLHSVFTKRTRIIEADDQECYHALVEYIAQEGPPEIALLLFQES